ncbi:hypothetical protein [Niveispirillum fermenti]
MQDARIVHARPIATLCGGSLRRKREDVIVGINIRNFTMMKGRRQWAA